MSLGFKRLIYAVHSCNRVQKLTVIACNRPVSVALITYPMCCCDSSSVRGLAVTCPQRKWSGAERSGDLTGQTVSLEREVSVPRNGCRTFPCSTCYVGSGTVLLGPKCTIDLRLLQYWLSCWGSGRSRIAFFRECGPIFPKADTPLKIVACCCLMLC